MHTRRQSERMRAQRDSQRLRRFRQSFRDQGRNIRDSSRNMKEAMSAQARERLARMRRMPRWLRLSKKIYHQYGLKHAMLILILILYQFLGAIIFYICEMTAASNMEVKWRGEIERNRTVFVNNLVPEMFNNTDFLFFLNPQQSRQINGLLNTNLDRYEQQLGIKYSEQKIKWDFWTAMFYAQTICTTIGYGHLYPSTTAGRVATMIYAIFGIPLVLSILDDLGKLLTKCLKYPWFLIKCGCRRMFRYCTKQTLEEIERLDAEDKRDLEVFDLPIPVAIVLVVGWIFICSATFTLWEGWDYLTAFYFFFISLSTIGLGDIPVSEPHYMLMCFGYIIIGLSLVSMCINLIQAKLERTYEAGKDDLSERLTLTGFEMDYNQSDRSQSQSDRRTTLGVLQRSSSYSLSAKVDSPAKRSHGTPVKKMLTRATQTLLSFPSPSHGPKPTLRLSRSRSKVMPNSLSIDDVMRLVDTEEGDMVVLTSLSRDVSVDKDLMHQASFCDDSSTATSPSGSFTVNKLEQKRAETSQVPPGNTLPTMQDIEEIEEQEDRLLLQPQQPSTSALPHPGPPLTSSQRMALSMSAPTAVHFRSRLSLIPEHQALMREEEAEQFQGGYVEINSDDNGRFSSVLGLLQRSRTGDV